MSKVKNILQDIINLELQVIKNAGTWKSERIISSKQSSNINLLNSSNNILNFCANNYLGLSSHPEILSAAKNAIDKHGAGLSSVRFICGTQEIHKQLEKQISKFHEREDAILYSSCFDANGGLFETLLNEQDAVISDELNHASIIDGIRLCKAQRLRYTHRSMQNLESQLQSVRDKRLRLIATDGVFSMDGNIAPLKDIVFLAEKYDALIFMDESHATGFLGKTGRGTEEYFGLVGSCHIINSTLGKALGGAAGGYTTGPKFVIDLLRNRSRPYLFSNSLPPPVVASAHKALELIMSSNDLLKNLSENTSTFRTRMQQAGFTVLGDKEHPICPVMLGDAQLAKDFSEQMLGEGIYVVGFSFPVVPKGKARIRVQLSAGHRLDEVNRTVDTFIKVGRKLKVIS